MKAIYFGGIDLSTFGALTVLDDPLDMPDRRGGDAVIPFRHGEVFTAKYFASRTFMVGITINDTTVTGLQTKLDNLRKLLSPRAEQPLSQVLDDDSIRMASASVNKSLGTKSLGPLAVRLVIAFDLSNPLFRANTITNSLTTINSSPKTITVNNAGTVEERDPTITLTGPLEDVQIVNETSGVVLNYSGVVPSAETVIISTNIYNEYTALWGTSNVIGRVSHSGSTALMIFNPGDNIVKVYSDLAATGSVKFSFYAPFL